MLASRGTASALLAWCLTVTLVAVGIVAAAKFDPRLDPSRTVAVGGPYARLLASAQDLGPSVLPRAQLTVALNASTRPERLITWATGAGLDVRWQAGADWAVVDGPPGALAQAFDTAVHDYRGAAGQVFYASARQPPIPAAMHDVIVGVGRILGYTPHRQARPRPVPLDVPRQGLTPAALLTAYNADRLAAQGFTGKGRTIVFFEFDGYDQRDLDDFARLSHLPPLKPLLVGGQPGESHGETVMDLQVAHAIAPDARLVVVNARPTLEGGRTYELIAGMFDSVDRQFPGAVWSLSIGWGCEKIVTATDLKPVQAALQRAQSHGTSTFDASGDTGGLECKAGPNWSAAPHPDDVGLDAVASLPAVTSVGGTTLSTDARGRWLAEQAWVDSPLSQGTSGGVSALFPRPSWQERVSAVRDPDVESRLTPDVSALADPFTGVRIRFDGQDLVGAGTSQAAPIWAALTTLMNQYLETHGGRALGDINPLLYRVAAGANSPGFRDVSLGANAVDLATPGYDTLTGLGTPNVDALVSDFLDAQLGLAPR